MRLLHTSDWHVGRTFHGTDLLAEQATVLGHLADLVVAERADVVLVAGDIYDRAVPSAEAVRVANQALTRLRRAGAQLVIIPGNHDSAPRLGTFDEFAAAGGLHLRTTVGRIDQPVVLTDEYGEVAVYGIPYLEPEPARHALDVPQAKGHQGVLAEAVRRVRTDLNTRPTGTRSVVLAHAFVAGGQATDSERTIAVGGVEQVNGELFDGVDYVALGHLHGAQTLADHLRYAGSPLAYSFSEARQRKSVWIVDLDRNGLSAVSRHDLPVPRKLAKLSGDIERLLTASEYAHFADCFLSVTLTDSVRPIDAMRRLRERFPHAVHLEWQPANGKVTSVLRYAEAVRGRPDTEVAGNFLNDCRGAPPNGREKELLRVALETAGRSEQ